LCVLLLLILVEPAFAVRTVGPAGSGCEFTTVNAAINQILLLKTDQRGGYTFASTPVRESGSAADIGAYEVQQDNIVFDTDFETCPN
jgi:hypothetical protein